MKFTQTPLSGAYLIEPEVLEDERGFFARTYCRKEFQASGLNTDLVQCNLSFNRKKGTLRGMHYQIKPHQEAKLIRCTMGIIYDVIIDLRPESDSYKKWFSVELTANDREMLYVPEGFAHGFQTLDDDCEIFYQMSGYYMPEYARGIRWNDPGFGIEWPITKPIISTKDANLPDFDT